MSSHCQNNVRSLILNYLKSDHFNLKMACTCRTIEREINAEQGTDLMENIVVLHIANKCYSSFVCAKVSMAIALHALLFMYMYKKKKKLGIFRGVAHDFKKTKHRAKPPYDN